MAESQGYDSNNQFYYEEQQGTYYENNDLDQEDIDNLDAIDRVCIVSNVFIFMPFNWLI